MFPNGDALYEYVSMRQSADRAYAARQRLAATARETAGIQPPRMAASEGLGRIAKRFGARLHGAFAAPRPQRPVLEASRADAARAGLA